MYDKFSERAVQVLLAAQEEAKKLGHSYVGTEHFLLGILKLGNGPAFEVIADFGINYNNVKNEIIAIVGMGSPERVSKSPQMTPRARKIIELAYDEAKLLGQSHITAEHVLLGIIKEGEGIAAHVLRRLGVDLGELRKELLDAITPSEDDFSFNKTTSNVTVKQLEGFGVDLTGLAVQGKLDPVIGREDEIERVIQILSRRKKNNPVLIGEPGVGKTAIVEGLAQRIVEGKVPETLKNNIIFSLDIAALVAGTKYRGEFEKRLKKLIQLVTKDKKIILFIDEIHTIVGAGAAEGAVDAANILKPPLSRGELRCIGATTPDEYRKYIEKDAALERRFQKVLVNEPTEEETLEILRGLRVKYETHHKVKYTDEALWAAVQLSKRYISDHFLPDKAIDVVDEAGARIRQKLLTLPGYIKEIEERLRSIKEEKELLAINQDYEKAALLREEEKKIEATLKNEYLKWKKEVENKFVTIGVEEIAEVVSKWTGIPLTKLEETETHKLLKLEEVLHQRVVGQNEAIEAVSKAIRRARSGLKDPRRPVGSFIFLGPTGVGKTELAKVLASYLFGDENALVRIDMSEYMERFAVSRLIGAPPGYVGYEEGGVLTEKVRRRPFSVILLDEIEKAHPDVFNILLQILDDGRLTDSQGRVVDFRNTIIIMTSNLGGELINKSKKTLGFVELESEEKDYQEMKEVVMGEVKKLFRPEFLNRVDEIIVFHPLNREHMSKIIDIQISEIMKRLVEKRLSIQLTASAKELLINKGFDPIYGARPLKRALQKYLEDPLAEEILKGRFKEGDKILVSARNGRIVFRKKEEKKKVGDKV